MHRFTTQQISERGRKGDRPKVPMKNQEAVKGRNLVRSSSTRSYSRLKRFGVGQIERNCMGPKKEISVS